MFRHRPLPRAKVWPKPVNPVAGLIFKANQANLNFGADAIPPRLSRPVLNKRYNYPWMIVLPLTSKTPKTYQLHHFYVLNPYKNEVIWNQPNHPISYVYYRYETLQTETLRKKIGLLSQEHRLKIARWQAQFTFTG
jgi:hypothetical protein